MGSKTQTSTQTSSTKLDKDTLALNKLRLGQEAFADPYRRQAISALMNPQYQGPSGLRFSTPEEAEAASRLSGLTNIDDLLKASQTGFETITAPSIIANATAGGFGRSGAIGEQLQRAGVSMALPVTTEARNRQAAFANILLGLGNRRVAPGINAVGSMSPFTSAPTTKTTMSQPGGFNPFDFIVPALKPFSDFASPLTSGRGGYGNNMAPFPSGNSPDMSGFGNWFTAGAG